MVEFNAVQSDFGIIFEHNEADEATFLTRLLAQPLS
jgi:hypothetical protein